MGPLMHHTRRTTTLAICIGMAVLGLSASAAADTPSKKAARGLAAITTGFLEIPGNMVAETRESGPLYGMTLGFVKGLGGVVVRELVGVYELVSAPFEVPEDYEPLISPEYPWGYFDEDAQVADTRFPTTADRR